MMGVSLEDKLQFLLIRQFVRRCLLCVDVAFLQLFDVSTDECVHYFSLSLKAPMKDNEAFCFFLTDQSIGCNDMMAISSEMIELAILIFKDICNQNLSLNSKYFRYICISFAFSNTHLHYS